MVRSREGDGVRGLHLGLLLGHVGHDLAEAGVGDGEERLPAIRLGVQHHHRDADCNGGGNPVRDTFVRYQVEPLETKFQG